MFYQKFKTVGRIQLFGSHDEFLSNSNSVYKTVSNFNNGKRMRFNLNGLMNDVRLSKNARLVMEAVFVPSITNMTNYINVCVVTSTEDQDFDTNKGISGNPIICTFMKESASQTYVNNAPEFCNIHVPTNFLQRGFIELEIESPVVTANVDFITSTPLRPFFITFVIIDEDDEQTQDPNLAGPVDLKLFGCKGQPVTI
jgi:hypothetical protein